MLLVLLLATGSGLAPQVTANADAPPPSNDQDALQKPAAVTGSTETFTTPSTRVPESYTTCAYPSTAIPDNDPAGVTSEIVVADSDFIGDLNIDVDVTHTWVGDLVVTIEHVETGTNVTIIDRPGVSDLSPLGCNGDDIAASLDDEAPTPVQDECAVAVPTIEGSFIPSNPLSAFDGENLKGTWRLTVSDHAFGDAGTLSQWCMVNTERAAYVVDSNGTDHLWMLDLDSRLLTDIGPVGYSSVEALAFAPDGTLYGIDDLQEELITIDLRTGAGKPVGALGQAVNDPGLAFDILGRLWMVDDGTWDFYRVNPSSGHATRIGSLGQPVTGLAARGITLFGLGGDFTNNLVTINTATGAATPVGSLGTVTVDNGGLSFDADGTLWGISNTSPNDTLFTIDTGTGAATVMGTTTGATGVENLAIPPVPVAYTVDSDDADRLWILYLTLGIAIDVGPVGYGSVEALAFSPDGILYGVDDATDALITLDLSTGAGALVGPLNTSVGGIGLASDMAGHLWMVDDSTEFLYSVDPDTGSATAIGPLGQEVTGLAARGMTLYGLGGDGNNNLVTINTATGAATPVGPLVDVSLSDGGLAFDVYGTLWGMGDPNTIFTINPATGKALEIATVLGATGFDNLAMLVRPQRIYLPLVLRAY